MQPAKSIQPAALPLLRGVGNWPRCIRGLLRDRLRRRDLLHQVVIPLAFDLDVGGCAEFHGLNQVVCYIGVKTRLFERVERRTCRAASDEPGLEIGFRTIGELSALPDVIAMTADQMR